MANEKAWNPEQKLLASARVYDAVREAMGDNPDRASQDRIIAAHNQVSILRECELTEAKDLLHKLSKSREFLLYLADSGFAKEVYGWLERNTGGHDGR